MLRTARGVVVGLALFGIWSSASLFVTLGFSAVALPISLAIGGALSFSIRRRAPRRGTAHEPQWSRALLAGAVAVMFGAVVYGSLATPARHWDGFCAWELKAAYLTAEPRIDQPFFADPAVFSPSRDYPLLQPLCVASGNILLGEGLGRLLFPALFLLFVALVHGGSGARVARPALASLVAAAAAVTPFLVNPSAGAADSGYGDAFLATAVTAMVAALVAEDPLLLASGTACAVLVKPEGLVYGAFAVAVLWCLAQRSMLRAATIGWLLAAAAWIPLQLRLGTPGRIPPDPLAAWSVIAVIAVAVLGADKLMERVGTRGRTWIALVAAPVVGLALPILMAASSDAGGAMALYLGDPSRPLDRLGRLPTILAGYLQNAIVRLEFGTTYILLGAALVAYARLRRRPPVPAATWLSLVGLVGLVAPFLLSPEDDTQHHIRSSMSRLLLHWLGAAWILIAVWLDDLLPPAPACADSG